MSTTRLAIALALSLEATQACAEILVGAGVPLTGRFAEQGKAIQQSLERAVETVNAAGGIAGESLKLVLADDGCEARSGAEAARKLVTGKVAVVIGHPCGSAALAAAAVYSEAKVIMLALTRHPELTDKRAGATIFRFAGRDDRQGVAIAAHILAGIDPKSVALVHDRTTYGRELTESVQKALAAKSIKPVLTEGIVAGDKDFTGVVSRLKSASATTVVFGGFPAEAAILLTQMRAAGVSATVICGDAAAGPDFPEAAGAAGDGVLVVLPFSYDASPVRYGPAQAASAFAIWLRAARQSPDGVAASMATPISGADGKPVRLFEANGDLAVPSYTLLSWQSGKLVPLPKQVQ